MHGLHSLIDV